MLFLSVTREWWFLEREERDPRPGSPQAMKTGGFFQQPLQRAAVGFLPDDVRALSPLLSRLSTDSEGDPRELRDGHRKGNRAFLGVSSRATPSGLCQLLALDWHLSGTRMC